MDTRMVRHLIRRLRGSEDLWLVNLGRAGRPLRSPEAFRDLFAAP
jgi:hypothetical protein